MSLRNDPLAERCLELVDGELKTVEEKVINSAVKMLEDGTLTAEQALQKWMQVFAVRELGGSLGKSVKMAKYDQVKRSKQVQPE